MIPALALVVLLLPSLLMAGPPSAGEQPASPATEAEPVTPSPEPPAGQASQAPPSTAEGETPYETPEEEKGFADVLHAGLSRSVLTTAEWLDSFFYDPRYAAEENRTRAIVWFEAFDEEDKHADYRVRAMLKLVLPQLKNRAHIVIAGDPDDQTVEQAEAGVAAVSRPAAVQDRNLSSSLGYFLRSDERVNISMRAGVRYRHSDLVLFLRPHYRVFHKLDGWALRFTQELPWWGDQGWESLTALDLERQFADLFFFRTSLVGHWYEDVHGYFYSLVFSLVQPLSPRRALHYDWINNFQTRPENQLTEIVFSVRYRQRLWRDWLYADFAPQARFPRDRDFDLVPGILFRVEILFGKY